MQIPEKLYVALARAVVPDMRKSREHMGLGKDDSEVSVKLTASIQIDGREERVAVSVALDPAVVLDDELTAADYEEVLADHRRLARELDVALNGLHGAARQASLCDLVPLAQRMRAALWGGNAERNNAELFEYIAEQFIPPDPKFADIKRGCIERAAMIRTALGE